jgi:hypothetical protein
MADDTLATSWVPFYRLDNECSSIARRRRQLSVCRRNEEKQLHGTENCGCFTQLALLPLVWF